MDLSSASTTQQEEPLDLSVSTHENAEMSEEDPQVLAYQHMILALMLNNPNILNTLIQNNFNTLMENNLNALIQNMQNMANSPSVPTPEDPPESETKENISSMLKELEEHESTPSPTHAPRRTSTGKIDRRMIGKGGARRVEANARERNRVQMLSKKFDELRICLPMEDDAKVSKLATLKVAAAYIGFLGAVLKDDEKEEDTFREILLAEIESAKTVRKCTQTTYSASALQPDIDPIETSDLSDYFNLRSWLILIHILIYDSSLQFTI
ncbi:hypothetical protein L5515_008647 [Caenorhabditis briggsae]|uniref:BHLH domain-containing protein n=1 Tax=Caenorhabditis briggsae TaxID=6238 RepID=A0AAE9F1Y2_CAEBR|nr:hypothetical protein L5515_008647 [Caenorhabditis briggsae]